MKPGFGRHRRTIAMLAILRRSVSLINAPMFRGGR
jgi:hypothetical protein